MQAVSTFAGIGFGVALARLGIAEVGVENDVDVCGSRRAAGMLTIAHDVWDISRPSTKLSYELYTAGPPCQTFSKIGKGHGRADLGVIGEILERMATGLYTLVQLYDAIYNLSVRPGADPRTALVLIPLLHILRDRPAAVALEQVPPVLPVWQAYAVVLRHFGYSVAVGVVDAEQYGVPQTRRRAVLLANRELEVVLPQPTHSRYHRRDPKRLDAGVKPWVSMAQALGWDESDLVGFPRKADGRDEGVEIDGTDYRARDLRSADNPSWAVTGKARSWYRWAFERPATTVMSKPRIWPPGHKVNADDIRRLGEEAARERYGERGYKGAYRATIQEGLKLQTFEPDFPLAGTLTSQWQQVGNAVPPLLAERLILAALGHDQIGYTRYA